MAHSDAFDADFWVGVVTAAPVLLVAFATFFVDLALLNAGIDSYGGEPRTRAAKRWITMWRWAIPILGGALTLLSVAVLAAERDAAWLRWLVVLAVGFLTFGVISAVVTVSSLKREEAARATAP